MRLVVIAAAHTPYRGALMERSAKRVGVEVVRTKRGNPGRTIIGLASSFMVWSVYSRCHRM